MWAGLLTSAAIQISLVQNTEQREGYARRVASRGAFQALLKEYSTIRNNDSTVRLLGPSHQ